MSRSRRYLLFWLGSTFSFALLMLFASEYLIPSEPQQNLATRTTKKESGLDANAKARLLESWLRSKTERPNGSERTPQEIVESQTAPGLDDIPEELREELLSELSEDEVEQLIEDSQNTIARDLYEEEMQELVQVGPELFAGLAHGNLARTVYRNGLAVGIKLKLPDLPVLRDIGLETDDVVTSIDGVPVDNPQIFTEVLMSSLGKPKLEVNLYRNGKNKKIEISLPQSAIERDFVMY